VLSFNGVEQQRFTSTVANNDADNEMKEKKISNQRNEEKSLGSRVPALLNFTFAVGSAGALLRFRLRTAAGG
jgi:hypothetical protein